MPEILRFSTGFSMPRSANQTTRTPGKPAGSRRPMTRSMLLPLPAATTKKMSLQFHLALAACRQQGNGNSYQFNELLRALYIAYHLQEMGFGALPLQVFAGAEFGMNASLSKRKEDQAWFVDARTASLLEQILALHDYQLSAIRLKDLTTAIERLEHFIRSQRASPLPNELRVEARKLAAELPSEAESPRPTKQDKHS